MENRVSGGSEGWGWEASPSGVHGQNDDDDDGDDGNNQQ